jgi:hypothetical protein
VKPWRTVFNSALKKNGKTPKNLNKDIGVPWATMSDWQNKKWTRPILSRNLIKACRYLNIRMEDL